MIRSFQARLPSNPVFDDMGELYGQLSRHLYADIAAGKKIKDLKRHYIAKHGISARFFNSLRIDVNGKINSVNELMKLGIDDAEKRIKSIKNKLKKDEKTSTKDKKKQKDIAHNRNRLIDILEHRIETYKARLASPVPGICFGSRKLFHQQYQTTDHSVWLADWRAERSSQFFIVGSHDESKGNVNCQATLDDRGDIELKLRLPDAFAAKFGKYLHIPGIKFGYGADAIRAAVAAHEGGDGKAITYRFVRDDKGWRVFISVNEEFAVKYGDFSRGAVGIDINADHITVCVTDRFGNPIYRRRIDTYVKGMTSAQRKAIYGDAAKVIVDIAVSFGLPLVVESLDFKKKKIELVANGGAKYARMLSSLAYSQIGSLIRSRAARLGVRVKQINPAYTSLIGDAKFSMRYGASVHQSAALVIARRGMGLSERLPRCPSVSLGRGDRGTFALLVKKRRKHVWSLWRELSIDKKAAMMRSRRGQSPPLLARSDKGSADLRSLEQDGLFLKSMISCEFMGGNPMTKSPNTARVAT